MNRTQALVAITALAGLGTLANVATLARAADVSANVRTSAVSRDLERSPRRQDAKGNWGGAALRQWLRETATGETPNKLGVLAPWRSSAAAAQEPACADDMALIEGLYCPRVQQHCLRWMDPPGKFHEYRCADYERPARCLAPRQHERFCIDRHERAAAAGGLPLNMQSWSDAKQACEAAGARVCMESEWTFACEGQDMWPYPYGFSRQAGQCNADRVALTLPGAPSRLRDERDPVDAHPACVSPFGVLDMAGNVAEWVSVDGHPAGSVVVQKGNWWQPGKHACRDGQGGHDRFYKGTETGFRCCADAK